MNKLLKSILSVFLGFAVFVGVAYAAYTVFADTSETAVTEPLVVTDNMELPATMYPGDSASGTYEVALSAPRPDQNVSFLVTKSDNLVGDTLSWEIPGQGTHTFDFGVAEEIVMSEGNTATITIGVTVAGDAEPGPGTVDFQVDRLE